jgi:hypothetical protein
MLIVSLLPKFLGGGISGSGILGAVRPANKIQGGVITVPPACGSRGTDNDIGQIV